jgi:hypothetical protein
VSTVFQPGSAGRNVIGCCKLCQEPNGGHGCRVLTAFALDLDEDREIRRSLAVPRVEWLQELQTIRAGVDSNANGSAVARGRLVGVLARVISTGRKFITGWLTELEWLAISTSKSVRQWVEGKTTAIGHSGDDIGRGDESMSSGVGIITTGKVTVVGRNDCKDVIIGEYEEERNILELGSPFLTSCLSH